MKTIIKAFIGTGFVFRKDDGDCQKMLNYMSRNGYRHHVAFVRGNWSAAIVEAFSNYLGFEIDRFGDDVMLIPDGPSHFTLTATVSVSPNFLGWLAAFGGRASLLFPQSAVDEYRALLESALQALP